MQIGNPRAQEGVRSLGGIPALHHVEVGWGEKELNRSGRKSQSGKGNAKKDI